ncbi:MAG: hypothetical protein GWP05_05705 [Anaerolineaceae bacterium]|nr:hypothetical protein [Anaerolineaceae bacterium]
MATITLLTDFGQESFFPAAMKGVILDICPQADIVDITHAIPEHDIAAGSYALYAVYKHFPRGTVHIGVVDPGVGGKRQILAVQMNGYIFLVPDNGLLSFILKSPGPRLCGREHRTDGAQGFADLSRPRRFRPRGGPPGPRRAH